MSNVIEFVDLINKTKSFLKKNYNKDTLIFFNKNNNSKISSLQSKKSDIIKDNNSEEKNADMSRLIEEYKNCKNCRLSETRNNIVFGEGNPSTKLVIIGEAPGANEDIHGIPFCGRAGELLTKMLLAINIDRNDIYITNIIKCRPPENRNPLTDEIENCSKILKTQLNIIKPKYILTLGNFAAQFILNKPKMGISKLRGKFYDVDGYKVIPTYHPAYLLRSPGYKKETWVDLQMLRDDLQK